VLGLSVDDEVNEAEVFIEVQSVLDELMRAFGAEAGIAGHEPPPPQSRGECLSAGPMSIQTGHLR
jgi:hypothetical protein